MRCIDRNEIEQFLAGTLSPERLLSIKEHADSCPACRRELAAAGAVSRAGHTLGLRILGVEDCPEYEQLSSFADGTCGRDEQAYLRSHLNTCPECARDLARIQELRSHASMREVVTVRPGGTRSAVRPARVWWLRVSAAAAGLALAGAVLFGVVRIADRDAVKQPAHITVAPAPAPAVEAPRPAPVAPAPAAGNQTAQIPRADTAEPRTQPTPQPRVAVREPAPKTVLADGNYRVIEADGRLVLVDSRGRPVRDRLDGRLASAVDEKLNAGTVSRPEPMVVAMNTLRSGPAGYNPPVTAPKLIAPVGVIIAETMPVLKWTAVDMAHSYRVVISDSEGNRVVERITDDTSLKLTEPLERGKVYLWVVGVKFTEGDVWSDSAAARFKVLSEDGYAAVESVKRRLPGSRLALGAVLESVGLYAEAEKQYRGLARENADSPIAEKLIRGLPETR